MGCVLDVRPAQIAGTFDVAGEGIEENQEVVATLLSSLIRWGQLGEAQEGGLQ